MKEILKVSKKKKGGGYYVPFEIARLYLEYVVLHSLKAKSMYSVLYSVGLNKNRAANMIRGQTKFPPKIIKKIEIEYNVKFNYYDTK